jgi:hypothetical protein
MKLIRAAMVVGSIRFSFKGFWRKISAADSAAVTLSQHLLYTTTDNPRLSFTFLNALGYMVA